MDVRPFRKLSSSVSTAPLCAARLRKTPSKMPVFSRRRDTWHAGKAQFAIKFEDRFVMTRG